MSDRFQTFVGATRAPQLVKDEEPQDDAARPAGYEAVRRIRSYRFSDVVFRRHDGVAQGFPWHNLRTWMLDDRGERLVLIWPEAMVTLTGRCLDQLEEDLMRHIVAAFRQVAPSHAAGIPDGVPVIFTMDIRPVDHHGDHGQAA